MKSKKTTRRALLTSMLSLLICVSMLVGSTFAWFTDSVTSANNIIKSGNLDVELYYQVEGQADWTKVDENTNVFKKDALWEPGHTEVVKLKVVNEGTLALKYQLGINVASETGSVNVKGDSFKLSDYIKFGIVDGAQTYTRDQAVAAVESTATALNKAYASGTVELASKAEKVITMVVYMPTSVDNEANYGKGEAVPTINLGINLFATQVEAESDSFGSDYDAAAPYELPSGVSAEDFGDNVVLVNGTFYATMKEALMDVHNATMIATAAEEEVKVAPVKLYFKPGATVTADAHAHICTDMIIYGNGAVFTSDFEVDTYTNWYGSACDGIGEDFSLTVRNLNGFSVWGQRNTAHTVNITLENCHDMNRVYINGTSGNNNITINSCSFSNAACSVYSNANGTINVTGTTFTKVGQPINLNHKIAGTQNVNIDGCTFVNCGNMAVDTSGWSASIRVLSSAADAKSVLSVKNVTFTGAEGIKLNGDILLNDNITSTVYGTVEATIDNSEAVVVTYIGASVNGVAATENPAAQTVVTTNDQLKEALQDGAIVVLAAGEYTMPSTSADVTITGSKDAKINLPFKQLSGSGNTITFEGVTIYGETKSSWYSELFNGAKKVIYKNCDIYDQLTAYCNSEFIGCTFYNTFEDDYSIFCYSGSEMKFDGCTFNTKCSKAIKIYDENNGARNVYVNNCTFNTETVDKAAVEIDSSYNKGYNVYFTGTNTITGAYTKLWNDKATNSNVYIDGVLQKAAASQ